MKKIAIVANFCRGLDGTNHSRFVYLAEMLKSTGRYDVELITSDFHHLTKKHIDESNAAQYNFKIKLCHEPGYSSHKGLHRLLSHRKWGKAVVKHIETDRPDIVYCAIPSLTAAHDLASYCKKHNIKFVIDVQDLWPEAIFMLADNLLIRALTWPMRKFVDLAYKNADAIVAVSQTYADRAASVNKKSPNVLSVFLGNDAERFQKAAGKLPESKSDYLKIGYIGTLSYSYDINCIIDAIKNLNDAGKYPHIKFIIMGDGPLKSRFSQYALTKHVDCDFTGMLTYEDMVKRLCGCDILVNPIVKGAAASITNKVGDYALAGLPVVNTQECDEYCKLISNYNCGINCNPSNANEVSDAIATLILNPELRTLMGRNAYKLGYEKFNRKTSYRHIIDLLDHLEGI